MANHRSAIKRIRSSNHARLRNRYQHKTARTFMKKLRALTDKSEAEKAYPHVSSLLDKLSKRRVIHKNKAANLKSKLAHHILRLS